MTTENKPEVKTRTRVKERLFLAIEDGKGKFTLLNEYKSKKDADKDLANDTWIQNKPEIHNKTVRVIKLYDEPSIHIKCAVTVVVDRETAHNIDGMIERGSITSPRANADKANAEVEEEEDEVISASATDVTMPAGSAKSSVPEVLEDDGDEDEVEEVEELEDPGEDTASAAVVISDKEETKTNDSSEDFAKEPWDGM